MGGPGGPPPGNKYRICPKIWPEGPSWGVWGCTTPKVSLYTRAYPLQITKIYTQMPNILLSRHIFYISHTFLNTKTHILHMICISLCKSYDSIQIYVIRCIFTHKCTNMFISIAINGQRWYLCTDIKCFKL